MGDYILEIKDSERIKTTSDNKKFYKMIIEEEKCFKYQHQLFTYAFLVSMLQDLEPNKEPKTEDICDISSLSKSNREVVLGIAAKRSSAATGTELVKYMLEYADSGIEYLRIEYENNGEFRLDKCID